MSQKKFYPDFTNEKEKEFDKKFLSFWLNQRKRGLKKK